MLLDPSRIDLDRLAEFVGLAKEALPGFLLSIPRCYYKHKIAKSSGGFRTLEIPYDELKDRQRRLLHRLLGQFPIHPRIFCLPGFSIKSALMDHVGKPMVITLDIANFFPSVKKHMVIESLMRIGFIKETSLALARIVTHKNHIPQGAPTSPCIGRLIIDPFAYELEKMLQRFHKEAKFSIYVDDIIISGPTGLRRSIPTIRKILERHGFMVKPGKVLVMRQDREQVALGVQLNQKLRASRKFQIKLDRLSKVLPAGHPILEGKRAWVRSLNKI